MASSSTETGALADGLYFTHVVGLDPALEARSLSLKQLLAMVRPVRSAHFNYCFDLDFLLHQYPDDLREEPIMIISGASKSEEQIRSAEDDFPNLSFGFAGQVVNYGVHHTKLSLLETADRLHVVISTANLIAEDWGAKTQAFYYASGAFRKHDAKRARLEDPFGEALQVYIRRAYLDPKLRRVPLVQYWSDLFAVKAPDFSHVPDRLVFSVPDREALAPNGLTLLRKLLADRLDDRQLAQCTMVAQCSSIGRLGKTADEWLLSQFLGAMCGKKHPPKGVPLKLVYPTMENMRGSLEGWAAGASFPFSEETFRRTQYLKPLFCQWKSDALQRTGAMPHIKSYAAVDGQGRPLWLLLTSANLSKAAWGSANADGRSQLVASFELGVLMLAEHHPDGLQLPFDWPLTPYGAEDAPFRCDATCARKDLIGKSLGR